MRGIWVILLFPMMLVGQVSYLSGSYSVATASGSGAGGVPTLSYTPSAGSDRVLIFFMIIERDHAPGGTGDNWASNAPTGGSVPTVEISTTTLSHLSSQWIYEYDAIDTESDADMSLELMVYGTLEANIPSGTNSFNITANFNTPSNAGDDAIFGAIMFENVSGMSNVSNSNCSSCNSISTAAVTPNDGNNTIFSLAAASGDRTISAGTNQTLIDNSSVTNGSGTYTTFSEQDGVSGAAQYRTGTILSSTSEFSASGAADMFGMLESVFRITATTALPVDLISFIAERINEHNILKWRTGAEINNDRFEIQKSFDGVNWELIGIEDGAGNTVEMIDYVFVDEEASSERTFYRLKQIDFDGTFAYSEVVLVTPEAKETEVYIFQRDGFIDFVCDQEVESLSIFNINGELIFEEELVNSKNYSLDGSLFNKGIQIVQLRASNGLVNKSFLIR